MESTRLPRRQVILLGVVVCQVGLGTDTGLAVKACYPCVMAKQTMVHFSESASKRVDVSQ